MVAVPHGEEHHGEALRAVPGIEGRRVRQGAEGLRHTALPLLVQEPAPEVSGVLHQVKVIERLQGGLVLRQRLDDRHCRIVGADHHMGQFHTGVLPHRHPGRDAAEHGPLRGADEGGGPRLIVVLLQIHHAHQPPAHLAGRQCALHIDEGGGAGPEDPVPQIAAHGIGHIHDIRLHVGSVQRALRQDEVEGGGRGPYEPLHPLPVFRLGGVLITGHHRPFFQVAALREQDIGRVKAQAPKTLVHRG